VTTRQTPPWVPIDRIEAFVQLEPAFLVIGLAVGAWLAKKFLLRNITDDRKRNLAQHFRNLGFHVFMGLSLFLIYGGLERLPYETPALDRFKSYIGLATIFWGAIVFVKECRILLFEYLFLSHRKVAFPVLLVNLFTLLLSIVLSTWIGAEIFNIRLTPILATSAIFSLVLGLALQDTLGNLFAGVALQFDKPYEIGDWIEIEGPKNKWAGQVYEISWRATVLISTTEESITVPNRVISQAEIANFSTRYRPIIRSQIFKLPFQTDIEGVKKSLLLAAATISGIRKTPAPKVFLCDTTESWVGFKLIYFIDDYGAQFGITDMVYTRCLQQLEKDNFKLATHSISIVNGSSNLPNETAKNDKLRS
jgi:small-conductance mechanosensitive channel